MRSTKPRRFTVALIGVLIYSTGIVGEARASVKTAARRKQAVKRSVAQTNKPQAPTVASQLAYPAPTAQSEGLLALANSERAARGLAALERSPMLDALAQDWAQQMPDVGFIHRPNVLERKDVLSLNPRSAAENIASGYRTVGELHRAWMNSDGHRHNLLRSTSKFVGIGVFCDAGGKAWTVQDFVGVSRQPELDVANTEPYVMTADDATPLCP